MELEQEPPTQEKLYLTTTAIAGKLHPPPENGHVPDFASLSVENIPFREESSDLQVW